LEHKSTPLAAWDLVWRPKDKGGLGIINLESRNDFLLMEHLHKFLNKADIPWVKMVWEFYSDNASPRAKAKDASFRWRDCLKCLPAFKILVHCQVNNSATVTLWKDIFF
jgi:hypothetical protein